jgi:rhodanese-related sulfurtransferase
MRTIDRSELVQMMRNAPDLALIEVVGGDAYNAGHLPGAINVQFNDDFEVLVERAVPDPERPVVVYGGDDHSPVPPQAARRLDALGYSHVFCYAGGKAEWSAAGMPLEH